MLICKCVYSFQVKLLYLVLFSLYLRSPLGIEGQKNLEKFAIFYPKASEPCLNIDISNVAYLLIMLSPLKHG